MIYPSADKIEKEVDSKYALVILAAKRSKQIKEGARPLVDTQSTNPLTVSLEEIASGAIKYRFDEASPAGQEALEDARAVIGNRDMDGDADHLAVPEDLRVAAAQLGADLTDEDLGEEEDEGDEGEAGAVDEEEEEEPLLLSEDDAEETEA